MKITTQEELLKEIEHYTQVNGVMPTKLCGKFIDLLPLCSFTRSHKFIGKDGFVTLLGFIEYELDSKANEPYFA